MNKTELIKHAVLTAGVFASAFCYMGNEGRIIYETLKTNAQKAAMETEISYCADPLSVPPELTAEKPDETAAGNRTTEETQSKGDGRADEGCDLTELTDINTAGVEELIKLKGIGIKKASAIIAFRENNGGFAVKDDLKNVKGIGEATYNAIKDKITVSPAPAILP